MAKNVGAIEYTIDAKTGSLLVAQKEVDKATGAMEKDLQRVDTAADKVSKSLAGLSTVARAVGAALVTRKIIDYANAWQEVNNKLVNSVRSNESLEEVTNRVFKAAQKSMSPLDATAALYSKLERATRDSGLSGRDLASIVETINKSFQVSGASASEMEGGIRQLAQALGSGELRGDEFNSVMENAPRLAEGIAKSMGVSSTALREMAKDGKITKDIIIAAVRAMKSEVDKEFSNMAITMSDAFTVATNNATKYFGENSVIRSGINAFNSTLITLSENLDVVTASAIALGAVMGGRALGGIIQATAENIRLAAANQKAAQAAAQQAAAEANLARQQLHTAAAGLKAALQAEGEARAHYQAAQGTNAHTAALARLRVAQAQTAAAYTAMRTAATTANAAIVASGTAAKAASIGMRIFNGALGLLGGPAGAIMTAAICLGTLILNMESTEEKAANAKAKIDELAMSFDDMSKNELEAALIEINKQLKDIEKNARKAKAELDRMVKNRAILEKLAQSDDPEIAGPAKAALGIADDNMKTLEGKVDTANKNLEKANEKADEAKARINGTYVPPKPTGTGSGSGGSGGKDGKGKKPKKSDWDKLGDEGLNISDQYNKDAAAMRKLGEEQKALDAAYKQGKITYLEYTAAKKGASKALADTLKQLREEEQQAKWDSLVSDEDKKKGQVDPIQQLQNEWTIRKQMLTDLGATQAQLKMEELAYEQQLTALKWEQWQAQSDTNALIGDCVNGLTSGMGNAITGLLNGTQSLSEMFANLGSNILGTVGNRLSQIAANWIADQIMMESQSKAAQASTTAGAVAAQGQIAAAAAPAAAATAASTGGSWAAAGAAALSAIMTLATSIFGGGRYHGGSVTGGNLYRVGEHNKPELFQATNGRQYMIPGENGRVVSNSAMGGGGINMPVNITVNTTNGFGEEDSKRLQQTIENTAMGIIRRESQRPGGMIQPRKK
ncbi:TPA: tape measure protein [Escherichia coli]|nr:tape measure protein [Escherichia coli]